MSDLSDEEEKLSARLQAFRFLVADPTPSRKSLRMLLSKLLIKPGMIELADTLEEADARIRACRPEFVFAEQSIFGAGPAGISPLVGLHRESIEAGRARAVMIVTPKGSESSIAGAAAESIDAVLLKPFTFETMRDEFLRVMRAKVTPPPFDRELALGKEQLERGNCEAALAAFRRARDVATEPRQRATIWYYEATAFRKLGRREEAMRSYQEASVHEPAHYRSMVAQLELYIEAGEHAEAYALAKEIAANHPVPMQLLPEFIRLSVLNRQLQDLVGFYKYAEQAQADPATMQHLSAGLAVCGLQFLKEGQVAAAVDAFRKAEISSRGSPRILKRILCALLSSGLEAEARAFFARAPVEVRESPDIKVAQLEYLERTSTAHHSLDFAIRLLAEGTRTERIYEIAIRRSVEIGRKRRHIEELLSQAVRLCPDKREWFEELATPRPGDTPVPGADSEQTVRKSG